MANDPSSLFFAAAAAAGLIEGSAIIRYYRHVLQQSYVGENDGRDDPSKNDDITEPSVSAIAAQSFLYGVVSVPLGIVGASPGHVFLPKSLSSFILILKDGNGENAATIEDGANDGRKRTAKDVKHDTRMDNFPSTTSDFPIVGTGRNVGRMFRHENSKKMTRQRHLAVESAKRRQNIGTSTNPSNATFQPSTYTNISSRYIATLDGKPLPTPLAEAMRRLRCMFIGAGIASYAVTHYLTNWHDNNRMASNQHETSYSHGCNHWINAETISLWNERIKNGRSIGEMDLLKELKTEQDTDGSIVHGLSKRNAAYRRARDAMADDIYNAAKWINSQLGRDLEEPPFSLIRHWRITKNILEPREGKNNIEEEGNSEITRDGDDETYQITTLDEFRKSSNVWNAAITSVGVLGTSVRHLLSSTYQLASAVANVGRNRHRTSKEEVDTIGEAQSDRQSTVGSSSTAGGESN